MTTASAVIETQALTKRYGSVRGIEDLSMTVASGEVFGFLGPNGAGKTTTIRTLLDLLHPTSGSARVFGLDSRRDTLAIRARTGNLPGDFTYDPRRTGRELLSFLAGLRGIDGLGRADELAERFDADLDRPLGQLSRGNRQKIGIVQALFHEPELLVLDEPTSGLDPLMQEEFLRVLDEQRARGRTVFLSSHELDEIERICDRVGIIRNGRLAAIERISDLTRKSFRHVRMEFAGPVGVDEFTRLPGVEALESDGRELRLRVRGGLDAFVKQAARHEVVDMEVTHPSLEEIFLTYYGPEHDS
jgi:ABC-2 type transport system ATP-binding protein